MKFDYAIGNPPYNADFSISGDNGKFAAPVYNLFMDAAYGIADRVELIHPARFLFNAGSTPKAWNEKMLNNKHFKVCYYEPDCKKVFSNTDIKGGVAITYYDRTREYAPIQVFTPYEELNGILQKIREYSEKSNVGDVGISSYAYHFTPIMHREHPEVKAFQSKGHENDLKSNIIAKLPMIFFKEKPDNKDYITIMGRLDNERVSMFIQRSYINVVKNLDSYKIFLPKASGVGEFGEALAPAIIAMPGVGHTETFFSIGNFSTLQEAENLLKYLKSRFARALLSILKKTQMITPSNFKFIPLQDFTPNSDINWSASIRDIDQQLYKKYGLSQQEIDFIESHVKEMA